MVETCGIFLYTRPKNRVLLCHATASANGWSIPKGIKEGEDDEFSTAVRELKEETSLDLEELRILMTIRLNPVQYLKQKKLLKSFLVVTDEDLTKARLQCTSKTPKGYPEIDKFEWVSLDEFKKRAHEAQCKALHPVVGKIIT